jgi:hypothetical protein
MWQMEADDAESANQHRFSLRACLRATRIHDVFKVWKNLVEIKGNVFSREIQQHAMGRPK